MHSMCNPNLVVRSGLIQLHLSSPHLSDGVGGGGQQLRVVTHHQQRAVVVGQVLAQPVPRSLVQVVRGLRTRFVYLLRFVFKTRWCYCTTGV